MAHSTAEGLREAYRDHFYRRDDNLTHVELSRALFHYSSRGPLSVLRNAFNQSAWKQAAGQAVQGWQKFIVVFKSAPRQVRRETVRRRRCRVLYGQDASRFAADNRTAKRLLGSVRVHARSYSFSVTPDPASRTLSAEMVAATDRSGFLAAVAADREAIAARKAQDDAEEASGLLPFDLSIFPGKLVTRTSVVGAGECRS
ncbi:MAG: hypothetical protein M3Y65_00230 [Pseudomonadota bacterium]|nr:hypothetical protein [Pseudomonadota bacterium]